MKKEVVLTETREVDAIFKKINEGVDLFNYYFNRHQSSNSDSQREKLENDLKKEIKKLQKYRDQIKTWQLNESMEAVIAPVKLQEHRKLVEEAMECYKDVEKNSKMKTYSNQSIMLAALELHEMNLLPEAQEAVRFLESSIRELSQQNEKLEEEYEKLTQKKNKKNASMEETKQEVESFMNLNRFHMEKLEIIIQYIKENRIDPQSVKLIQEDITFYLESNQEPDFVNDESLYDEILKEAESPTTHNNYKSDKNVDLDHKFNMEEAANGFHGRSESPAENATIKSVNDAPSGSSPSPVYASSPQPYAKQMMGYRSTSQVSQTPDVGIVKSLKPATAPPKPAGNVKWALAAAGVPNSVNGEANDLNKHENPVKTSDVQMPLEVNNVVGNSITSTDNETNFTQTQVIANQKDSNSRYLEVLRNSRAAPAELELFSDTNLIKLPPGIQDLIVSFTATRKTSSNNTKLLFNSPLYNPYTPSIKKPYLPLGVQGSTFWYLHEHGEEAIRPPLHFLKLQSYWNRIRATNQFDQLVQDISQLSTQNNRNVHAINELMMAFFFGYYYGFTPLENLIAESCLFKLNWKPYSIAHAKYHDSQGKSSPFNARDHSVEHYYYWFKSLRPVSPIQNENTTIEFGDFQIFDVHTWDIYLKVGFALDLRACQLEPSRRIC